MIKTKHACGLLAVLFAVASGSAQTRADEARDSAIDVEWDPSVLLLRGFSAVVAFGPESLSRWRFALDVFTFESPSLQLEDNWSARAYGASAIVRYHHWGAPHGLWVSANVRVGWWRYRYRPVGAGDDVFAMSVQARVGYNWFPFGGQFYVNPQIGLAVPISIDDPPSIAGFEHPRLDPFPVPALHIGYSF